MSFVTFLALLYTSTSWADSPPGGPGLPHRWAPALKQAVGTSYEESGARSPIWFTLAENIVTEVFYPSVDQPQVSDLQFIVTDGVGYFSEQKNDTTAQVNYLDDGMTVRVSGYAKDGTYQYEQLLYTDPHSPVLRIRTRFKNLAPGMRVFILFHPAMDNSGNSSVGNASEAGLHATRDSTVRQRVQSGKYNGSSHAFLVSNHVWKETSAGYVGVSDGWQELSRFYHLPHSWKVAGPGNIALTGEIESPVSFDLALGFGSSRVEALSHAQSALSSSFEEGQALYEAGWKNYARLLRVKNRSSRISAQIIKMHEDKSVRGAIVASLSSPGIPSSSTAQDPTGGYHLVWPRDLYHAAMGLMAAGDRKTPIDVLNYYRLTQKPDGSWSQNFWVNGVAYWPGLQMDQVSFPILLTAQLKARGLHSPTRADLEMIRKAADFLSGHGPITQQDRWEEVAGYVPSTLAAEIAALRQAERLTKNESYGRKAREWESRLEEWTLVPEGPHGKNYYLRVSPDGVPTRQTWIDLHNGAGQALANEILDGGFLELVRLGIRSATHSNILNTLAIYESPSLDIAAHEFGGMIYRRYNRDGYGLDHKGGFWPLLAGERGHYAIFAGDLARARSQLQILEASANSAGLIPEQTPSLGVACPLVWAHAEDILLNRSLEEESVFDAPPQKF